MILALFLGGIFGYILMLIIFGGFLYIIYLLARHLKGSVLLNFFGLLYIIYGTLLLILILIDLPSYDITPLLAIILFALVSGFLLMFVQKKKVLTPLLLIHVGIAIFGLFISGGDVSMLINFAIGIPINIFLIVYVNFLKDNEDKKSEFIDPIEAWETKNK